jgi:glucosamine-6-phosphate deaminase
MRIQINKDPVKNAARLLNQAIREKGEAVFVASTGKTQIRFLRNLVKEKVDWSKTIMFHLDEYIGLSQKHKASFQHFLHKHLIDKVDIGKVYLINGKADPVKECDRLSRIISKLYIDVTFLGVGVNGHLAFNDPPADFRTRKPYRVVKLSKANKQQQVDEGWFKDIKYVPKKAISMSIRQIMKARNIICLVYGEHKAKAVKDCFYGKISPIHPASILQKHKKAVIYLDKKAAKITS